MNSTPVLYFDGDCHFCHRWVGWIRRWGGGKLYKDSLFRRVEPYRNPAGELGIIYIPRAQAPSEFQGATLGSVMFVDSYGRTSQGAKAIYQTLEILGYPRLWSVYQNNRLFAVLSEASYRIVSHFRSPLSRLFDVFLGPPPEGDL